MCIKKRIKEEKIRFVDFTNQAINRFVCYSNILTTGCCFLKDNGVNDFVLLDYIDDSNSTKLLDSESLINN